MYVNGQAVGDWELGGFVRTNSGIDRLLGSREVVGIVCHVIAKRNIR